MEVENKTTLLENHDPEQYIAKVVATAKPGDTVFVQYNAEVLEPEMARQMREAFDWLESSNGIKIVLMSKAFEILEVESRDGQ